MDIQKDKRKILALFMIVFVVIIAIAAITLFHQNTITQTKDTWTHEAGQELQLDAFEFFDTNEKQAPQITFDTSSVDIHTVGEYTATASFKNKTFEINVAVVDTTAPMVEFANRYVFTNDITNADLFMMFEWIYDSSEYTTRLIRFERKGNLQVMDQKTLKSLTDTIPLPCDVEELETLGSEEVPTEAGVYRAVLEIADVHGNVVLEEVYVIYDTTGALIEDVPDKVVYAAKDDLDKEPEIDKNDYTITDNVDGVIDTENIHCELVLHNAQKHEWLVDVSYTDRAGNNSKAEFLIIVKEGSATTTKNNNISNSQGSNNDGGTTTPGNTGNNGDTDSNATDGGNYDPADTDKDGVVTEDEASVNISEDEQKVIDAGYGNVVRLDSGDYAVLTHGDGYVNQKHGFDILSEYLTSQGLYAASGMGGCWIHSDNDWYWCIAENITPIDTSGNDW